ncbi:MAG: cobalamin-dependent protein, partial [Deltaproteobacteria bacterium]|nr:cobalamin-dependent protein [Deltaproteobacteria bacterium]
MEDNIGPKNWNRIQAAMAFEEPDQVPFFLHSSGPFHTSLNQVPVMDYYNSVEKMLEVQQATNKRFNGLTAIAPDLSMAIETSAMGAEITWTSDGNSWVQPFVKTEEDIEKLEVPDLDDAAYMTKVFEYYRYMKEKVGKVTPVAFNSTHSPWGVAALIRGTSEFFADVVENPGFVKKLTRKTLDLSLTYLRAMQEAVGPENFTRILLWDDLASFVSLEQFREFVLPLYEEIFGAFPQCERWYHNDADATYILEGIADAGIQVFHYGYEVDPAFAKEKIGDRVCLVGNVPPLAVLRNGTPVDVENSVREIIGKSGKGGGLIIAAGGYLDEGTPAENIDAMIRACEKYGKKDGLSSLQEQVESEAAEKEEAGTRAEAIPTEERVSGEIPEIDHIRNAVISGQYKDIQIPLRQALEKGIPPQNVIDEAIVPAMDHVGQLFSNAQIFIPEMLMAAKASEAVLEILSPIMVGDQAVKSKGKVAIATVKEDLHDIGKNIVLSMMQGGGFEVVDLGVDCPAEKIVEAVRDGAQIVGLSAVLTTVLPNMKEAIDTLEREGLREKCRILIGGAAVTPPVVEQVGADAYCRNAGEGVTMAKEFIG